MGKFLNLLNTNISAPSLGDLLEKRGILSKKELKSLAKEANQTGNNLSQIILSQPSPDKEDQILRALSDFFNLPAIFLRNASIHPPVLNLIPKEVAEQHQIIIFKKIKNNVLAATCNPEDQDIVAFINKKTSLTTKLFITTKKDIDAALKRYHLKNNNPLWPVAKEIKEPADFDYDDPEKLEKLAESVSIIKMLSGIIEKAVQSGASDIHFEPGKEKVIIRFRVDGVLHKISDCPKNLLPLITARIKVLANLKIDEHILPQDGRFQYLIDSSQELAIRVSIIPTLNGPKSTLRLLAMKDKLFTLKKLGLNKNHYQILKDGINYPYGIILVTGPTGSGKTTTLYTLLKMINKEGINICTIEDPIEYGIENINQMQIKPELGLTFARGLRALLRQDPNVLMIGEIRDLETAEIATNAAMTGHLVFSTLHTNNAFLAPQRLVEMGLPPYLISSVANLIIGQRLVRKLCPHCRSQIRANKKFIQDYQKTISLAAILKKLKFQKLLPPETTLNNLKFYRPKGCAKCNHTGYQGRIGIYEIIKLDQRVKQLILQHESGEELKKILSPDILSMTEDGILKVFHGTTTIEEVLRATKE